MILDNDLQVLRNQKRYIIINTIKNVLQPEFKLKFIKDLNGYMVHFMINGKSEFGGISLIDIILEYKYKELKKLLSNQFQIRKYVRAVKMPTGLSPGGYKYNKDIHINFSDESDKIKICMHLSGHIFPDDSASRYFNYFLTIKS